MDIKARIKDNTIILDLSGTIDVNGANFIEVVGQCLRDGYTDIVCNFESVDLIDYMGVSVVVIACKEVLNHRGRLRFCALPSHLKSVFGIAGLDRVIDEYATEELALQSLREARTIEKIQKIQMRRRFKRLPIDMKVEIHKRGGQKTSCEKADLLNLSGVGAYIYGCGSLQLEDHLTLKLKLPPKGEEIELKAKVVWLSDPQLQHPVHPGMGVTFYDLAGKPQERLLEFIDRNLSHINIQDR
jgi:anti-anti-sigma factor